MRPFSDDNDDPKMPRPVDVPKKREGLLERYEAGTYDDRDYHRHGPVGLRPTGGLRPRAVR